jgi:hypothetical protein
MHIQIKSLDYFVSFNQVSLSAVKIFGINIGNSVQKSAVFTR